MRVTSAVASAAFVGSTSALNSSCSAASIQAALPAGASVNFAYPVAANATFEVPKGDTGYPNNPVNLPSLCAVSVQVKSIGNSTYGFGLFLPEEWNGRFLAVGNGGFAGGINWVDMVSRILSTST
jgi:feruloyl esterase